MARVFLMGTLADFLFKEVSYYSVPITPSDVFSYRINKTQ